MDTSHFVRYPNRGAAHKGGNQRVTVQEMSVYNRLNGYREGRSTLLRLMVESGQVYTCAGLDCDVSLTWKGAPITLEIDHINRDYFDNRMENLRFLCPNCHSQTVGFSGRKTLPKLYVFQAPRTSKPIEDRFCACGAKIGQKATRCVPCHQKVLHAAERPVKGTWPTDEELKKLLWERPALQVAKDIGVSSGAVKKWCKNRNIPTPPRGYWAKLASKA